MALIASAALTAQAGTASFSVQLAIRSALAVTTIPDLVIEGFDSTFDIGMASLETNGEASLAEDYRPFTVNLTIQVGENADVIFPETISISDGEGGNISLKLSHSLTLNSPRSRQFKLSLRPLEDNPKLSPRMRAIETVTILYS